LEENIMSGHLITEKIKDFWRYASTLRGTHDIEDVFIDWTNINNGITISELKDIWEGINNDLTDIKTAFDSNDIESITNLIQTVMRGNQEPGAPVSMEDVSGEMRSEPKPLAEEPVAMEPATEPATETETVLKQMAESGGQEETPPEQDKKPPGEKKKDDRDYMLTESLLL